MIISTWFLLPPLKTGLNEYVTIFLMKTLLVGGAGGLLEAGV